MLAIVDSSTTGARMSLSDLASLGSFISGVAVLVSLVFLYFQLGQVRLQIGQAEKNQQASIRQARITRAVDIHLARVDPTALAEGMVAMRAGTLEHLTAPHVEMMGAISTALFLHAEDSYFQHRNGLLDEDAFRTFTISMKNQMRSPTFRVMWKQLLHNYEEEFSSFVDSLAQEVTLRQPTATHLDEWKRDVAAEVASTA